MSTSPRTWSSSLTRSACRNLWRRGSSSPRFDRTADGDDVAHGHARPHSLPLLKLFLTTFTAPVLFTVVSQSVLCFTSHTANTCISLHM
uniref:Uncharacterized protein n=1 Tax=Anguilla anguilla TaxID=7936 RepID=A0A0E9XGW7_ANGAN